MPGHVPGHQRAASDWSVVIISTLHCSLTGSRDECLRVVGILEMVEYIGIHIVCYPFQHFIGDY